MLEFPTLSTDVSYGRIQDSLNEKTFFYPSTPEKSNHNELIKILNEPVFSTDGGFYSDSLHLQLTCEEDNINIYYTLDCTEPTENSILYTGGDILIDSTTVIRSKVFKEKCYPSKIVSNTYIYNKPEEISICSIVVDPILFNDSINGILSPMNLTNIEIPATFSYWDVNPNMNYKSDIGLRLHGNYARTLPQKPFRLTSRSNYEKNEFEFDFFENKSLKKYK